MQSISTNQTQVQVRVNDFIRSVYNWMGIGLALTGLVAYSVANTPAVMNLIIRFPMLPLVAIIAWFILGIYIRAKIAKLRASTATVLFLIFSGLMGFALSTIFFAYTATSITSTFLICSATFVACSIYGWTTKRDLTSMGGFLFMGLIGIIIASIVNIWFRSPQVSMIVSYLGVLIFIGLTAYDTQNLKAMAVSQPADVGASAVRKGAILGALSLYVNFINLFLFLLHIFGVHRD
ncbi:MAG: Bax inhibitor-1/YccA family protein [Desulfobacterales bacterium]|nr:Bax inhibitor-1/YccA family protein [Desulfobacterales bacterium]